MNTASSRTASALTFAVLALSLGCRDAPTEADVVSEQAAFNHQGTPHEPKLKPTFHYARVRGDGTLIDGTATTAGLVGARYDVTFPPPIGACAATVTAGSFPGATQQSPSFVTTWVFVNTDDQTVSVVLFSVLSNSTTLEPFMLILACP